MRCVAANLIPCAPAEAKLSFSFLLLSCPPLFIASSSHAPLFASPCSIAAPQGTGAASPCAPSSHHRVVPPSSRHRRPFLNAITTEHPALSRRGRLPMGSSLRPFPNPAATVTTSTSTLQCSSTISSAASTAPSCHHHCSPLLGLCRRGGAMQ
jgi:hypothetical protein